MINARIRTEILRRLAACEHEHGIRILMAVESGSRAWGMASANSDFDVRFVYVHSVETYSSPWVENRRDAIASPTVDQIDCNGWDLRKACRMLDASNPWIVEWLQSQLVYRQYPPFVARALALLPKVYSPSGAAMQYRRMAASMRCQHLIGESVSRSQYLYTLRPLLAARWIEQNMAPPPAAFESLLQAAELHPTLLVEIQALLRVERCAGESGLAEPIGAIDRFIGSELQRELRMAKAQPESSPPIREQLDWLFQQTLESLRV